jgi:hypothetical protein
MLVPVSRSNDKELSVAKLIDLYIIQNIQDNACLIRSSNVVSG